MASENVKYRLQRIQTLNGDQEIVLKQVWAYYLKFLATLLIFLIPIWLTNNVLWLPPRLLILMNLKPFQLLVYLKPIPEAQSIQPKVMLLKEKRSFGSKNPLLRL